MELATKTSPHLDLSAALRPRRLRVRQRRRETADVFTFALEPIDPSDAPAFRPGQFNMLYAFGVGDVPISISGDPEFPDRIVHTIRSVGQTTRALCALERGDVVTTRGPFGTDWPLAAAAGKDLVIVAGGIGLAPLRPAIYEVLRHRDRVRRVVLLYGARTPDDILFRRELEEWRGRFDLHVYVTVDRAAADWRGYVGVVTNLIHRAPFEPSDAIAFICGPEVMMHFSAIELQAHGIPPENMFVSMERNMKCGCGFCGHCQLGPVFVCKDGPVFRYDQVQQLLAVREL
jgi:NAD(P)H-flavin reductase